MITIELLNEAVKKLDSQKHETKFVVCTGEGLIKNGIKVFNDEIILPETKYLIEIGNYPYSYKPTAVRPLKDSSND